MIPGIENFENYENYKNYDRILRVLCVTMFEWKFGLKKTCKNEFVRHLKLISTERIPDSPNPPVSEILSKNRWIAGSSDKRCLQPAKKSKISTQSVSIEDYIIFECQHIFTLLHHFAPAASHSIEVVFVSEANFDCAAMQKGGP